MALEYLQILLVLDDASYQRNMHNLLLLQAFSGKTKIVSTQFQFFFEPNICGLPVARWDHSLNSWAGLDYCTPFNLMPWKLRVSSQGDTPNNEGHLPRDEWGKQLT